MRCLVRAGLAAALVAFVFSLALAADKAFKQSELDAAAIKLEAQIKSDAGSVSKPAATLKRDADAAFQKNDFRAGMLVLGQLVAAAPDDATSWLRLSRAVLQIKPRDDREKALLLDRASTAAYIAYQRAGNAGDVVKRQPIHHFLQIGRVLPCVHHEILLKNDPGCIPPGIGPPQRRW